MTEELKICRSRELRTNERCKKAAGHEGNHAGQTMGWFEMTTYGRLPEPTPPTEPQVCHKDCFDPDDGEKFSCALTVGHEGNCNPWPELTVAAPTERVETSDRFLLGLRQAMRVVVAHHKYASDDFSQEAAIWRAAVDACVGSILEQCEKVLAVAPSPAPAACNCRQFCICDAWAKPHCHYCKLNMENA